MHKQQNDIAKIRRTLFLGVLVVLGGLGLVSPAVAQTTDKAADKAKTEVKEAAKKEVKKEVKAIKPVVTPAKAASKPIDVKAASTKKTSADADMGRTIKVVRKKPKGQEPGATTANINREGGVGFQNIAAADGGGNNTFRAAFLGGFYVGGDAVRSGDDNTSLIGRVLIQGTFLDYLSVNLGLSARNNYNSFGQPQAMLSQGDLNLGVRGFYPVNEMLKLGGDLSFFFPSDFGGTGFNFSATSVRPRLLASMDFRPLTDNKLPMDAHLNVGYRIDNSENGVPDGVTLSRIERFAYGVSAYDLVEFGLGTEFKFDYVRPFLAYTMGIPVGGPENICQSEGLDCASEAGFGAFPKVLTLGAKVEPIPNLGLHAAVDFGLASRQAAGLPATAPYTINLGLSWTIDPTPKVEYVTEYKEKIVEKEKLVDRTPVMGYIKGVVVDNITEKPIKGATIEYVEAGLNAQVSGKEDGKFRSYGFGPGSEVTMKVTHPDYKPTEVITGVKAGEQEVRVKMEAIPRKAFVEGKILNVKGKPVNNARISIFGKNLKRPSNMTVDAAGQFTGQIVPGEFFVAVKAKGYLAKGRKIVLKNNEKLNLEFVLTPRPKKTLAKLRDKKIEILDKVFFEKNKSNILSKSYPLLDTIVSILVENPQVKSIRIEGHTDDSGSAALNLELSQSRAESVRNYLIKAGVAPSRLTAKGFGPKDPLVPNTSRRNRELNRRVEFKIVDQGTKKP